MIDNMQEGDLICYLGEPYPSERELRILRELAKTRHLSVGHENKTYYLRSTKIRPPIKDKYIKVLFNTALFDPEYGEWVHYYRVLSDAEIFKEVAGDLFDD